VRLLRPAREGEPQPAAAHLFRPLRQVIESINQTFKGQPDLARHGGQSPAGVIVRVLQRILALTAAIWHNDHTGQPTTRSLVAYDHGHPLESIIQERIADTICSDRTLRRRRDEWTALGVMLQLWHLALAAYDRMIGLDLSDLAIDGCITKAPCGGEVAGRSPVGRGKHRLKRSMITDATGIPLGVVPAAASRNDHTLLGATLDALGNLDRIDPFPEPRTRPPGPRLRLSGCPRGAGRARPASQPVGYPPDRGSRQPGAPAGLGSNRGSRQRWGSNRDAPGMR
jgi:hypothetical protein